MIVIGLDIAKSSDYSVLVAVDVERLQVTACVRLGHISYKEQITQILPALERAALVVVDSTGVGAAVSEMLPKEVRKYPVIISGGDKVVLSPFGATAGKRALIQLIGVSRITVAENAVGRALLRSELENFGVKWRAGKIKLEAVRGNDDAVLALSLALLGVAVLKGGHVKPVVSAAV